MIAVLFRAIREGIYDSTDDYNRRQRSDASCELLSRLVAEHEAHARREGWHGGRP
jgi:hypothetical protein